MYVFDALPILLAMVGFNYFWPARFLAIRVEASTHGDGDSHGLAPMVTPTAERAWSSKSSTSYQQV